MGSATRNKALPLAIVLLAVLSVVVLLLLLRHALSPALGRLSDKALIEAIEKSDHKKLGDLLRSHASASGSERELRAARLEGRDYSTPLRRAVELGDKIAVHLLLEHGADPDCVSSEGESALQVALHRSRRDPDMFELLLSHGADPNVSTDEAPPALVMLGVWRTIRSDDDTLAIAELLLSHGADVNAANSQGMTPLHHALIWNAADTAVVELLLRHGADVNALDEEGGSPYHYVVWNAEGWYEKTMEAVMAGSPVTSLLERIALGDASEVQSEIDRDRTLVGERFAQGFTLLHAACRFGPESLVEDLIAAGADVNAQSSNGSTPLLLAVEPTAPVRDSRDAVVKLLLAAGADPDLGCEPDSEGCSGKTPLTLAIRAGDGTTALLLTEAGADVNQPGYYGKAPLHVAAGNGLTYLVADFLDRGADVDATDEFGRTPLYLAARCGSRSAIRLLVQHGANVHAANHNGTTPLDLARRHPEILKLLDDAAGEE